MKHVTATTPSEAAAPTTSGSLFRERGKICMGVGGPAEPVASGEGSDATGLAVRIRARAKGPLAARAYTKSGPLRQCLFYDALRKSCARSGDAPDEGKRVGRFR